MAKKRKIENNPKLAAHPTIFVFDGSIRYYEHGSMLELYSKIKPDEWSEIVEWTYKYHQFLECLKSTAFPMLHEKWTDDDEWFRIELERAVSRMRNIDPLLVAKYNADEISSIYKAKMIKSSQEIIELIKDIKEQQSQTMQQLKISNI